jgi:multisubunit Na+/H+ antiporter MnhB subunit
LSGVFLALAILLRPDGGFLLITIGIAMMIRMWVIPGERRFLLKGGVVLLLVSLSPLVPWAIRNWKVFHVFQPLVTRGLGGLPQDDPCLRLQLL